MALPTLLVKELDSPSVTPRDCDLLTRLGMAAFKGSPGYEALWPNPVLVDGFNVEEHAMRIGSLERSLKDPSHHHVVVVEESEADDGVKQETYVGFAIWAGPPDPNAPEKTAEEKERRKKEAMDSWPPSLNREEMKLVMEEGEKLEQKCMGYAQGEGGQKFWKLIFLAVDPNHQRKGIGRMLTQWGMDEAAKADKDVCLIASPAGTLLYTAMGFETVAEFAASRGDTMTGMRLLRKKEVTADS